MTVTIASLSGPGAVFQVEKIFIPDETNIGATGLAAYVAGRTYTEIESNNIAVLKMKTIIPLNKYTYLDVVGATKGGWIHNSADENAAAFVLRHTYNDYKFRVCGIGVINNYGSISRPVVKCTEVNFITDPLQCKDSYPGAIPYLIPPNQYCMKWPDRDNNACIGDFGGPVYGYKYIKGELIQFVVCTLVGSPNLRKNAQCLGGHITFCTLTSGDYLTGIHAWIINLKPVDIDDTPAAVGPPPPPNIYFETPPPQNL